MQVPLQVAFRHMERSEEIETLVREKVAKLGDFSDQIVSCHVVVEPKGKQRLYDVRINLTLPGIEISVSHEPSNHPEYKDVQVALRDAFDSAVRQIEDSIRRKRGFVKTHEPSPPRGSD